MVKKYEPSWDLEPTWRILRLKPLVRSARLTGFEYRSCLSLMAVFDSFSISQLEFESFMPQTDKIQEKSCRAKIGAAWSIAV